MKGKRVLEVLLAIEVMLSGLILGFVSLSLEMDEVSGLVMSLMILVVAAGESCIGLGILVSYYALSGGASSKKLRLIRG